MKIAYVANHGNRGSDDTEGHIAHALEKLGHRVVEIPQRGSPAGIPRSADLLLFHHWTNVNLGFLAEQPMPKACWYFDKIWNGRDKWIREIAPLCERVFMTDGTWAASSGIQNVSVLRQGIGDRDVRPGTPRPDRWKAQIAFLGSVYGERTAFVAQLRAKYGERFQVYNDVFNRDLYDLCATVPILVAPAYPADDHYWSNRVYLALGSGGFLLHPRLAGLAEEYDDGVHLATYGSHAELEDRIDHYLRHDQDRREIAAAGFARTHDNYSFTKRCQKLLKETLGRSNTGMSA